MPDSLLTAAEETRLAALRAYNILDSLTEKEYENITYLASVVCEVPVALISFVDEERQWFKSHRGLVASETALEYSFCAHALQRPNEMLVVPDSREDARFKDNPLVTGDPNIVFYAGIPLVTEAGDGLGTVCVIDTKPRELSEAQQTSLRILASEVMRLLELRKENIDLRLKKIELEKKILALDNFSMVVAHDIKSPLSSINLATEILEQNFGNNMDEEAKMFLGITQRSARKIKTLVDGILSYTRAEGEMHKHELINISEMLDSINGILTSPRKFVLRYQKSDAQIYLNRTQLEQVFINLINNGIRYNDKPLAIIRVSHSEDKDWHYFEVADNGIGIKPEDQKKIFQLYETVDEADQVGVRGNGIGLPTVKRIIESYNGTIILDSVPGEGLTLNFKLPRMLTGAMQS